MSVRNSIRDAIRSAIGLVGEVFNPRTLFLSGEQGVWYDPSDLSALFQDAAGTIPVTGMEQPVGLMLDKSKGLVRGAELVTNGDFNGGVTGWSAVASAALSVSGGALEVLSTAASYGAGRQVIPVTVGKTYEVSVTARRGSQNAPAWLVIGGAVGSPINISVTTQSPAKYSAIVVAAGAGLNIDLQSQNVIGAQSYFDNATVKELPGNHATQPTAASRPILTARKNLLTATNNLTAGWVAVGTLTRTPQGALTFPTNLDFIQQALVSQPAGTVVTVSIEAKRNSGSCVIRYQDGLSLEGAKATIDTATGTCVFKTPIGGATNIATNVVAIDAEWDRYTLTGSLPTKTSSLGMMLVRETAGQTEITVRNPQLEVSPVATRYQWVKTATDYDYAGFPIGLRCDGVDDGMVTPSIDFSGTDKMFVCAGLRTLSTVTTAVVELSADVGANNGTFLLAAPVDAGNNFRFRAKGTLQRDATSTPTYPPPVSVVAVGQANIPGDTVAMRLNGTPDGATAGDLGTGNFGNYPLYLFRRGGASLPFNGLFYGAIIAGSTYSASQIASAERYLAGKSGVTV